MSKSSIQKSPIGILAPSLIISIIVGILVWTQMGISGLLLFLVLTLLEITFSFDNAVLNSRILERMSPVWQKLFLTVGIFFAVFVVRFVLPILIVMLAAGLGFGTVIDLALNNPSEYGERLHDAGPIIDAFGGTFLILLGVTYFFDNKKVQHWIHPIEHVMSRAGEIRFIELIVMGLVTAGLYLTVNADIKNVVLTSAIIGIGLQFGLNVLANFFDRKNTGRTKHVVGLAAFALFMYLQVLDASLSFDGVIGAFAITTSIVLIMAGLGVGALWVRSLTIYLMRAKALKKYQYLEHGAHWAILALGVVMLVKLYHIELAEWITGSLGLVFIGTAVLTSILENRWENRKRATVR